MKAITALLALSSLLVLPSIAAESNVRLFGREVTPGGSPYNVHNAAAALHRRHHANNEMQARSGTASEKKRGSCPARLSQSSGGSSAAPAPSPAPATSEAKEQAAEPTPSSSSSWKEEEKWASSSSSSSSAQAAPTSSSAPAPSKQDDSSSSDSNDSGDDSSPISSGGSGVKAQGSVSGFSGTNSGIGSWFRTNAGSDSTNGMSWCETKYQNDWPCFAPSVGTMMSGYSDRQSAAKAYCGREAKVTNTKTGASANMFICDGFDDKWVKTPGSIDLTTGAFTTLNGGQFDGDKNHVLQVSWELTGNVVEQGTFQKNKYS